MFRNQRSKTSLQTPLVAKSMENFFKKAENSIKNSQKKNTLKDLQSLNDNDFLQ